MTQILNAIRPITRPRHIVLALSLILASAPLVAGPLDQSSISGSAAPLSQKHATHYSPNRFSKRAAMYYRDVWGIDALFVRSTESGELVRFSYRVLDPERAAQLNDKKLQPTLIDARAGVQLVIPSLEKVGQLRQSSTAEAGRDYWMAFSNPGRTVKRGDHVTVVIGRFRADGLVVE